jgi:replication factor C subunit 3/5
MTLWCDKYRPHSLKNLDFNKEQAERLRNLVEGGDFPHLLFYGPSGAGKKTRVLCLLREVFGSGWFCLFFLGLSLITIYCLPIRCGKVEN